jgi:hypothetical protein
MGLRSWLGLKRRPSFEIEAKQIYRERLGDVHVTHGTGFDLVTYENEKGFDYEAYQQIQTLANKAKLDWAWIKEENVQYLCDHLAAIGVTINSVLCHGTRNASEQTFFKNKLPSAEVLGTEISDTATQFPMTIQWDFHETKPEWIGAFDLVFSNSWDHTYAPAKLFTAWLSCIRHGGALALEWTTSHAQTKADPVDPFRADLSGLQSVLAPHLDRFGFSSPTILRNPPNARNERCYVIAIRR